MSLRDVTDSKLILDVKTLVGEEKRTLQSILEYLCEIERRRLFAARGYSSLFEFCVKELNYSESSAQRRISSMRLIKSLPEAKEKLTSGNVNLSTLSQLQTFIKREEDFKKSKLTHDEKLDLLKVIENKSQRECEREFVKISPDAIKVRESIKPMSTELVEFKFVGSKDLESKLKELQNLLSHQDKSHSISELIEFSVDLALKNALKTKMGNESKNSGSKCTSAAKVKREVFRRDNGQCQFQDPLTKRKCLSSYKIQIDHIHPKAMGGKDAPENLRLFCAAHNQLRAIQVFSSKHMSRFVPDLK